MAVSVSSNGGEWQQRRRRRQRQRQDVGDVIPDEKIRVEVYVAALVGSTEPTNVNDRTRLITPRRLGLKYMLLR
ncbi:hypothetical protein BHE74_00007512 [Ensete ventricosum]|nr:hypothetical protein GW17_00011159 [Ensete ventricosum]RWW83937.1 hypothetical protein BHE74_00007512 [Ensete ventricosum]RZS04072.1 hypothetical protein BHM03_00034354 [Ensete ventricosum]